MPQQTANEISEAFLARTESDSANRRTGPHHHQRNQVRPGKLDSLRNAKSLTRFSVPSRPIQEPQP